MSVKRVFVQKKPGFDVEAQGLKNDLVTNLSIQGLRNVSIIIRYDIEGLNDEQYAKAKNIIFSEPPVDNVFDEEYSVEPSSRVFATGFLPGQYDQRADSAVQCIQMLTAGQMTNVKVAKLIVLDGDISDEEFEKIKKYCINPVESQEVTLEKPESLDMEWTIPDEVEVLDGFCDMDAEQAKKMVADKGLAMSAEDVLFTRDYFRDTEKREPTITELRMLDTYWSDHCRHTTFLTGLDEVVFEDENAYSAIIKKTFDEYKEMREDVYGERLSVKPVCLMDMATIAMKMLRNEGCLDKLDQSEEINACSIVVNADMISADGEKYQEEWLIMFKNETHNHPTEIEPFGGAATCLGGAIRDPLSGRSYVYQAMRVTGCADPRKKTEETMTGKLPQRKLTTGAAHGYSSYGNQIGLTTGKVTEIYDAGYVAKRMEIGAVVGAAPKKNVRRERPEPGDVVVLLGGRTGRDGCGGATGSSKEHTEESLTSCGAEVQKGNAPTERKLQRLFRKPEVSQLIKRCNDFGAGGVSVAIGELADGLIIQLDKVPKKYEGLDGTELAISESQERMAVVVSAEDVEKFVAAADAENLEATVVADVTEEKRLVMIWNGKKIVDISRAFIDTNGVVQHAKALVKAPSEKCPLVKKKDCSCDGATMAECLVEKLGELNNCSQKGLGEMFDSSIGASSVLSPFGGKYQLTPSEGMVAKLPVEKGDTETVSMMSHGFDPAISKWSPFHGAAYAIIESVNRLVAMGADYKKAWLTLQEYFEKLAKNETSWGKPVAALLGAIWAQKGLGLAAIGGKDSMSGTFMDINVPPTLVSFALAPNKLDNIVTNHITAADNKLVLISCKPGEDMLPKIDELKAMFEAVYALNISGKIKAAATVKNGGIGVTVAEMAFGNKIGVRFLENVTSCMLFAFTGVSMILEVASDFDVATELDTTTIELSGVCFEDIAVTIEDAEFVFDADRSRKDIADLLKSWTATLEPIFPTVSTPAPKKPETFIWTERNTARISLGGAKPRVFIPVFPGTNCEYDTAKRFEIAGADPHVMILRNLTSEHVVETLDKMTKEIEKSQIIMIPGGFSAGDEPEGSGKFIATAFRNPQVADAVNNLLKNRDGLVLGICNGFQALIKLGLLPYGEIREIDEESPTLTYNNIGRHVSCYVNTRVSSVLSPWLANCNVGDVFSIPVSHGEGRFVANDVWIKKLAENGQIAFQYTDFDGVPSDVTEFNPNGSVMAIEGITSPDGRVLGKMGHSERIGQGVGKNIYGAKNQKLFEAGVAYFK